MLSSENNNDNTFVTEEQMLRLGYERQLGTWQDGNREERAALLYTDPMEDMLGNARSLHLALGLEDRSGRNAWQACWK